MAWTNRTKIINQLINRDEDVAGLFGCVRKLHDGYCDIECSDCVNAWLDEEVEYTPKVKE